MERLWIVTEIEGGPKFIPPDKACSFLEEGYTIEVDPNSPNKFSGELEKIVQKPSENILGVVIPEDKRESYEVGQGVLIKFKDKEQWQHGL